MIWTLLVQSRQSFVGTERTKLCPLCSNKVHIIWWSYLRDFSLEYLLTYKKRIYFFWKSSIADAGNQTRRCGVRVHDSDHYTITAWMKCEGYWVYLMNILVVFHWGCIGGQPQRSILTSGLWFWKIAGLRPAIFSETPRNFEAIFTML